MSYRVGQLASMAGVTVRTLHHYDEIGLLSPAGRTGSGHRTYDDADVERLQSILFYRELGFGLEDIAVLLDDGADAAGHFRRQRDLLAERLRRVQEMHAAVDDALSALAVGASLTVEERLAVFGRWRPATGYLDAVQARWGSTKQWRQGRERMARYTPEDLAQMQSEMDGWVARLRNMVAAGVPPTDVAAMDLLEEHRQSVSRWWFDCDHRLHREFARMCADDPEQLAFLVRPDRQLPGMGAWLHAAADANAARH